MEEKIEYLILIQLQSRLMQLRMQNDVAFKRDNTNIKVQSYRTKLDHDIKILSNKIDSIHSEYIEGLEKELGVEFKVLKG